MAGPDIDLKALICDAWNNTPKSNARGNREKSSDWVGCLGTSFQSQYNGRRPACFLEDEWQQPKPIRFETNSCSIYRFAISTWSLHQTGKATPISLKDVIGKLSLKLNNKTSREITRTLASWSWDNRTTSCLYHRTRVITRKRSRACAPPLLPIALEAYFYVLSIIPKSGQANQRNRCCSDGKIMNGNAYSRPTKSACYEKLRTSISWALRHR